MLPAYKLFGLRQHNPEVYNLMVTSKRAHTKRHFSGLLLSAVLTSRRPLSTYASAGDSQTFTGKSGSVSCGVTAHFPWVLVNTRLLFVPLKSLCFPRPVAVL